MLNRTILIGRLTRDPELRYTTSGVAVARFSIAVDRRFTNQQGEREVDFINIVTWRGLAENCAKYTKKGSLVCVDGRIQTGKYEKEGRTVYTTDIVAEDVRFLDSKGRSDESGMGMSESPNQGMGADPFGDGKPIDISDDDLPF